MLSLLIGYFEYIDPIKAYFHIVGLIWHFITDSDVSLEYISKSDSGICYFGIIFASHMHGLGLITTIMTVVDVSIILSERACSGARLEALAIR